MGEEKSTNCLPFSLYFVIFFFFFFLIGWLVGCVAILFCFVGRGVRGGLGGGGGGGGCEKGKGRPVDQKPHCVYFASTSHEVMLKQTRRANTQTIHIRHTYRISSPSSCLHKQPP